MLKLIDNVDLKEFEKNYENTIFFPCDYRDYHLYINKDRSIGMPVDYSWLDIELDTLYDLIKDGLVEKDSDVDE